MESPCGFVIEGQGVPLHETLHWVYRESEEFNDQNESFAVIIAFDLTTEEFREMPLPVAWLQEEDSWVALFSCRGCLCLWKYGMRAASASASVECWVMETYGVTDSWTRGPNFSISNPPELIRFLRPLLVTETSRVLLRNSADGELELVKIDDQEGNQEEEIVTYMHRWNHEWFSCGTHMIVYEETLLSCQVMEPIQPGIRVKKKTQNAAQRPHRAQMMIVIAGMLFTSAHENRSMGWQVLLVGHCFHGQCSEDMLCYVRFVGFSMCAALDEKAFSSGWLLLIFDSYNFVNYISSKLFAGSI